MSEQSRRIWPGTHGALLLALAVAAGIVDPFSYLGLGKVFTANMTGNTVLLGVAVATGDGAAAARSGIDLGALSLGVAVGVALTRPGLAWPRRAAIALWLEVAAALAGLLALWAIAGVAPVRFVLIATTGVAMGLQTATVRASEVRGVNTTYMTGTHTNAIARATLRPRGVSETAGGPSLPAAAWVAYGVAALGARGWRTPGAPWPSSRRWRSCARSPSSPCAAPQSDGSGGASRSVSTATSRRAVASASPSAPRGRRSRTSAAGGTRSGCGR